MPRYSTRLRPIYDENEPTLGEGLTRGISTAIEEWEKRREADRQERNTMAAAGGVPIPAGPQPSIMDRLRGIGQRVRDSIHGTQPSVRPARDGIPAGAPPALPANVPVETVRSGLPTRITGMPQPGVSMQQQTPRRSMNGIAAGQSADSPIGNALGNYTYEGIGGQKYSVDPLHQARVQAAAKGMSRDAEQEKSIAALVAAGMPENEARARVLTNTVRYDTEFGQQSRARSSGLTFEQRQQLQNENNAVRLEIARMARAGKQNTDEFRRANIRLREIGQQLQAISIEASGYENTARAAERGVPQGTDRIVEESMPGGKERISAAQRKAGAARDSAAAVRGRARSVVGGAGAAPAPAQKMTIGQPQYDKAIAAGYSDAKIAELYNIPITVKRKR